jgi:hypothetical protein
MFLTYLALGLGVLVLVLLAMRWIAAANPATLAAVLKWLAIALGVGGFVLLISRGGIGLLVMILAALLPLLSRWQALASRLRAAAGPARGQASRIHGKYVSMELDHDSGTLDGAVLAGRHQGRRLRDLSLAELLELRIECLADDPDSLALVEAYLDRIHGAAWRANEAGAGTAGAGATGGFSTAMTRDEALQILGLGPSAGIEEIREAHRRLMQKLHPDHGGTNYLAAKINQAKEVLLGA